MEAADLSGLVRRHAGLLHKVAFAYCRGEAEREEVLQEIALALWRSWERFDERFAESTWVYRIALNVAISFHRRERRHQERRVELEEHALTIVPSAGEPSEEVALLSACIDELGPLEKALVLLYLDGNDHRTTAEVLGISVSNVGTKLGRVKERLRLAFEARARANRLEIPHATG